MSVRLRDAKQFVLFAVVGAVGTAAHFATLIVVVERFGGQVLVGSSAGFLVGALVNYFLNYHLTFASTQRHAHAMPRFLLVATVGMLLNVGVMGITYNAFRLPYLICQVIATVLVLFWNFGVNRLWTFGSKLPSRSMY